MLACAKAVISNDSGLMRLAAAAVDAPLIAIYGPSDPGRTPPLADKARILSPRSCSHLNYHKGPAPRRVLEGLPA